MELALIKQTLEPFKRYIKAFKGRYDFIASVLLAIYQLLAKVRASFYRYAEAPTNATKFPNSLKIPTLPLANLKHL